MAGLAVVVALAVGVAVGGCSRLSSWWNPYPQHEMERQDEAGESHVAVLSVAPWEDYVQRLQPEFSIDSATALDQSMPVTVQMEERLLAALGLKFSASSPQLTKTYTETDKIVEGKPTTTKESKTEATTGDLSKVPTGGLLADKNAPEASKGTLPKGILGVDPMLHYSAATVLYQEVKIINTYLRNAAIGNDYRPYLLRLQISLIPKAHNEPYDAYTMLTFF